MQTAKQIIPAENQLGECVLWDERTEEIIWIDIDAKQILVMKWGQDAITRFNLNEKIGSLALTSLKDYWLIALERSLAVFDRRDGSISHLVSVSHPHEKFRLNDGRSASDGSFWVGGMIEALLEDGDEKAGLYRWHVKEGLTKTGKTFHITNGIAWKSDGKTVYVADSVNRTILNYTWSSSTRCLSDAQLFYTAPRGAFPDGACIDAEGRLWSALWQKGCIVCLSSSGEVLTELHLPTPLPTCVGFVGPKLDHLAITASEYKEDEIKKPGSLFIFDAPEIAGVKAKGRLDFKIEI